MRTKNIKLFEQYIREFVDNSETKLEDLQKARTNARYLFDLIYEELDPSETLYDELMTIRSFRDVNNVINTYYNTTTNVISDNLEKVDHLLKDLIEQFNISNVRYNGKDVDIDIDKFIADLNCLIPYAINKLDDTFDVVEPCDIDTTKHELRKEDRLLERLRIK